MAASGVGGGGEISYSISRITTTDLVETKCDVFAAILLLLVNNAAGIFRQSERFSCFFSLRNTRFFFFRALVFTPARVRPSSLRTRIVIV